MRTKSVLFSGFTFICGVFAGRYFVGTTQLQSPRPAISQSASSSDSERASIQSISARPSQEIVLNTNAPSAIPAKFYKSPEISIVQLKKPVPILDQRVEDQLGDLIRVSLPSVKQLDQKPASDGSVDVYGTAEDGKVVFRHFNSHGDLTQAVLVEESRSFSDHDHLYPVGTA